MARKRTIVTEDSVEYARMLLDQGIMPYAVRRKIKSMFRGSVRSHHAIIAEARKRSLESNGSSRKEMRETAKRRYEGIIADPATITRDRIRAIDALSKLYGLPMTRVIHSGTGEGGAIKTESKGTLEVLAKKIGEFDFDALRSAMTPPSSN